MGLKARLSPRAISDLDSIRAYLTERSPRGAESVRTAIAETVDLLEQFPGAGRATTIAGVRMIPVVRYDYLIYYKTGTDEVVILHVRHAAREAPQPDDI